METSEAQNLRTIWSDKFGKQCQICAVGTTAEARPIGFQSRALIRIYAETESDVVRAIALSRETRIPIYPTSTGKNWGYGSDTPSTENCVSLDLSRMAEIDVVDAHLGIFRLGPGVTQAALASFLATHHLPFMVPTTGAGPTCSIVGNALERGYGITPYIDHFSSVTSLRAVLANGEIYQSAMSNFPTGARAAGGFRWGVGPYLDGVFSQGNFGVVTWMTVALARRPAVTKTFLFSLSEGDEVSVGILAREVQSLISRLPGVIGSINLMNTHRTLAMTAPHPNVQSQQPLTDAQTRELAKKFNITNWTGFGTLYGEPTVVAASYRIIRSTLKPICKRVVLVDDRKIRIASAFSNWLPRRLALPLHNVLRAVEQGLRIAHGEPNEVALKLCYWRTGRTPQSPIDPARDNVGLIWYAPIIPATNTDVERFVEHVMRVCEKHQLEPLITLTALSDRCFDGTVPILFDPSIESQASAAHACIHELVDAGIALGFIPYRLPISVYKKFSDLDMPSSRFAKQLRNAIDPSDLIAPGRYSATERVRSSD